MSSVIPASAVISFCPWRYTLRTSMQRIMKRVALTDEMNRGDIQQGRITTLLGGFEFRQVLLYGLN